MQELILQFWGFLGGSRWRKSINRLYGVGRGEVVRKIHSLKGGLYNFNEGEHQNTREPNIGGIGGGVKWISLWQPKSPPPPQALHKSEYVSLNDLLLLQYCMRWLAVLMKTISSVVTGVVKTPVVQWVIYFMATYDFLNWFSSHNGASDT